MCASISAGLYAGTAQTQKWYTLTVQNHSKDVTVEIYDTGPIGWGGPLRGTIKPNESMTMKMGTPAFTVSGFGCPTCYWPYDEEIPGRDLCSCGMSSDNPTPFSSGDTFSVTIKGVSPLDFDIKKVVK